MDKRTFKAQIVNDFKSCWLKATAEEEGATLEQTAENYGGEELAELSSRISGRAVDLTENHYPCGENDYFEVVDNNFVMHPECWTELEE